MLKEITVCPGTLVKGFNTYSPACLRNVFNGKKASPFLPYESPQSNELATGDFLENRKRISISGVQEKLSLILDKNMLRLTRVGEQGTHVLKPIPGDLKKVDQVPANEHLTMQIARQVYGLNTAENALIFFSDGTPAYITKRFDVKKNGEKWGQEDFATLAGKSNENSGSNFKYDFSYEEAGLLIQQYVPAWQVETEKYFSLIVFNYLFSNGDAHLKNFSILESSLGDYFLSPAYDLINTHLHVDDSDFALSKGLFKDDFRSEYYRRTGHPGKDDFAEFAHRIGVKRFNQLIQPFLQKQALVETLTGRSFLTEANKRGYLQMYLEKRNHLISSLKNNLPPTKP